MKGVLLALILLSAALPAAAKTLVIDGRLESEVVVRQTVTFGVTQRLSELTYRFPQPATVESGATRQHCTGRSMEFSPRPTSVTQETDRFGNSFSVVTWRELTGDARVDIRYTATIDVTLEEMTATAPYPLSRVPEEAFPYLQATRLVQSDDPDIRAKAGELTGGMRGQYEAVTAIIDFVTDQMRYEVSPLSHDARYGLTTGTGNCQNYAHLACALLRAAAIPARVAVGLALKEKWKVPLDSTGSSLVQGMGEGLHAWIEVWFPERGWLPFDPQQSRQFTSTRHIKYTHAAECADISPTWSAQPLLPGYDTRITTEYLRDRTALQLKGTVAAPRGGYVLSNRLVTGVLPSGRRPAADEGPRRAGPDPPAPLKHSAPLGSGTVIFGNTRFPSLVKLYTTGNGRAEASLERETAEYVTSDSIYAQAFTIDRPMKVGEISLAMHKFGGDGTVYVDLVADDGTGKPGLTGFRSLPTPLERIERTPGYAWVDFRFPAGGTLLSPGKHWIVLRHSGEAVMNWFFTPGKPVSGPDDTRSTARGWHWEDILTYDFVFRVTGTAP